MPDKTRSADQMVRIFEENPVLLARLKSEENPIQVLEEVRKMAIGHPLDEDKWLYRIAVVVLGLLTLIAAIGSIVLVLSGADTPEVLVALGSAAVGALVGLFAPSPSRQ